MLASSRSPQAVHNGTKLHAGFVLVGGRSSRMGEDKARLPWRARSLVECVATEVSGAVGNVALIGAPERYGDLGLDLLADLRPGGCGPLAGIETALASGRGEWNLIVACDMPGLTQSNLTRLLDEARLSNAPCVAARGPDGRLHPLCAVYRNTCLVKVRQALDAGRLKLHSLLDDLHTVFVEVGDEIWNVNTPEEWKEWRLKKHIRTT